MGLFGCVEFREERKERKGKKTCWGSVVFHRNPQKFFSSTWKEKPGEKR
jgi:hypothetical protein